MAACPESSCIRSRSVFAKRAWRHRSNREDAGHLISDQQRDAQDGAQRGAEGFHRGLILRLGLDIRDQQGFALLEDICVEPLADLLPFLVRSQRAVQPRRA